MTIALFTLQKYCIVEEKVSFATLYAHRDCTIQSHKPQITITLHPNVGYANWYT